MKIPCSVLCVACGRGNTLLYDSIAKFMKGNRSSTRLDIDFLARKSISSRVGLRLPFINFEMLHVQYCSILSLHYGVKLCRISSLALSCFLSRYSICCVWINWKSVCWLKSYCTIIVLMGEVVFMDLLRRNCSVAFYPLCFVACRDTIFLRQMR